TYLKWVFVVQSDVRHAMVSWSLFLLLGVFVSVDSHIVFYYTPCHTYDVVV
ncbi:hypothetical protein BHM03_00061177, partial [Ensete ventricosum]